MSVVDIFPDWGYPVDTCPKCLVSFSSRRGMERHFCISHGYRISFAIIECDWCGLFQRRFQRSDVKKRENHWCSVDCRGASPENHPGWDGGMETVNCCVCGEELERKPYKLDRSEKFFCGQGCYGEWRSENLVGEGHPVWKGGHEKFRGPGWSEIASNVRRRDSYTCQECGISQDDLWRSLDVHHIVPYREFDSPSEANSMDNLVSLCHSCHMRIEDNPGVVS